MHLLLEESDLINTPVECFYFDSTKQNFPVKPHWHYYMEILYMMEGNAKVSSGNDEFILQKSDMVLFHPKTIHSILSSDGQPIQFYGIKLDISRMNMTSDYSPKLRSIFRHAEKGRLPIVFPKLQTSQMNAMDIFYRCVNEYETKRYCYDLMIRSELYRLLIEILRSWQEKGFTIGSEVYAEDGKYDIYNITEYIDASMDSELRVSDIASQCGMSYSHFAKKFHLVYHESCKSYIQEMRIQKAKDFLTFTDFDLIYISQESGYTDSSHMIKSFKKATGLTPKEYRKKHLNILSSNI